MGCDARAPGSPELGCDPHRAVHHAFEPAGRSAVHPHQSGPGVFPAASGLDGWKYRDCNPQELIAELISHPRAVSKNCFTVRLDRSLGVSPIYGIFDQVAPPSAVENWRPSSVVTTAAFASTARTAVRFTGSVKGRRCQLMPSGERR